MPHSFALGPILFNLFRNDIDLLKDHSKEIEKGGNKGITTGGLKGVPELND